MLDKWFHRSTTFLLHTTFQSLLIEYFCYKDSDLIEEAKDLVPKIKLHINKAANFASFKRWIIFSNDEYKQEFSQYL